MHDKPNDLLLLAGKILTFIAQIALTLAAVGIAIAIPLVLFFRDRIDAEIIAKGVEMSGPMPILSFTILFLVILGMVGLSFVFFGKLRAFISSVGEGDPFVPENTERLNLMAWISLIVQGLMLVAAFFAIRIASWVGALEGKDGPVDWGFGDIDVSPDIDGLLLVVVLFILARVFKHGTALRDDLEGTV